MSVSGLPGSVLDFDSGFLEPNSASCWTEVFAEIGHVAGLCCSDYLHSLQY